MTGEEQERGSKAFAQDMIAYARGIDMGKIDNDKHISVFVPNEVYEYCKRHKLPYNKLILLGMAYHKLIAKKSMQERARRA
jgi:hypothetical protein